MRGQCAHCPAALRTRTLPSARLQRGQTLRPSRTYDLRGGGAVHEPAHALGQRARRVGGDEAARIGARLGSAAPAHQRLDPQRGLLGRERAVWKADRVAPQLFSASDVSPARNAARARSMRLISARRSPDGGGPEPFEGSAVDRPAREGAAGVDSSAGTLDTTGVGTSAGALQPPRSAATTRSPGQRRDRAAAPTDARERARERRHRDQPPHGRDWRR